ncbi:hypothetical protein BD309DRAFT_1001458 [Dichomitus squalens]|nr:hypothetical protein BD309DRAFT_1001458 [Dichomitus squalens]
MHTIAVYDSPEGSQNCRPTIHNMHSPPTHVEGSTFKTVAISEDAFACILQDNARVKEYRNNPEAQHKPLLPPAGVETMYLFHIPTSPIRWLYSRHLSSFHSVQILFRDSHLYILGRMQSTYVLCQYWFSPDILIHCVDDTVDHGEPLAQYESPPLPDPNILWGSCDREEVYLDLSSLASILAVREWFPAGRHVRFPLQGQASAIVPLVPETHLRDEADFHPRWLGRDQALMFYQDDDLEIPRRLVRLSFSNSDDSKNPSSGSGANPSSIVCREALSWLPPLEECQLGSMLRPDVLTVDEESGRICFMLLDGKGVILSRSSD